MEVALIVEKITGYLDLEDLLQFRRVNNLWNECAKLHIKKFFFSLNTAEKIWKLMELFTDGSPLLKFDILVDPRNQNLRNLIQKFGKYFKACRFKIDGSDYASPELTEALMDILRNSPNLQILRICKGIARCIVLQNEVNCFLPKLNSFTFEYHPIQGRDEHTIFLKKMLDASPSLQYLKIKNIYLELSSLIGVVANRNIKAVHLKQISGNSFQDYSSFNEKLPLELASVSVHAPPSAHIPKLNEFLRNYTPTMRYLKINEYNSQFVQIPTMKNLESLKLEDYCEQENSPIQFNQGQFPTLKRLRLGLKNSQKRLNFLMKSNLPLQNLNQLELLFSRGTVGLDEDDEILPASIELPLDLPLLELLRVKSYSVTNITFPKTVNLRKLIMHNGFENEGIHLQFPNLKVLHIIIDYLNFDSKAEDLHKLFNNLAELEELTLELRCYSPGTLWKILTGLARGDKHFMKEVISMMRSNMTSLAQELLSESKPNLGNLTALKYLTVQESYGAQYGKDHIMRDHMDASISIAFLVFCGKLKNLTKLEISLLESSQRYFDLIFGDILSSNNTRYHFLPPTEDFYSIYDYSDIF